jgi:hypothetical protein
MSSKNLLKWLVNTILFFIFLAAYFLDLTGLNLHQWLGLLAGIFVCLHLINHRQWVKAVTQRFFHSTNGISRLNYLLDASLAIGIAAITISGLIISTWFGVSGSAFEVWRFLHVLISIASLVILLVKLALHWKCIAGTFKQVFTSKPAIQPLPFSTLTRENPNTISRREALRTVGAISLAGALVLVKAVTSLNIPRLDEDQSGEYSGKSTIESADAAPIYQSKVQSAQTAPSTTVQPSTSQSTNNCTVRCSNGCSYPGRCRRYTDGNNNGRCDLGECL